MKWCIGSMLGLCLALALLTNKGFANGGALKTEDKVQISPQTLLLGGQGCDAVTVHTTIPFGLVADTPTLAGLEAAFTFADDTGALVAKFARAAVEDMVSPGNVTLTLRVPLTDGTVFEGSDTITVKAPR